MFLPRIGFSPRIGLAALALAATIGLGGCTDGYGYNGVSLGYGSGDYYDASYYDGGYGYGGGYGGGYGWYGDYYYPGTGYYIYDRNRRAHRWNDGQRRYWEGRRDHHWDGRNRRDNWQGFNRDRGVDNRDDRQNRWGGRQGYRNGQATSGQVREERRDSDRTYNPGNRGDRGASRQGNRPGRRN
ncbi:hypothetical protein ACVWZA_003004 [Sphingomonas sp. UYAg733]